MSTLFTAHFRPFPQLEPRNYYNDRSEPVANNDDDIYASLKDIGM